MTDYDELYNDFSGKYCSDIVEMFSKMGTIQYNCGVKLFKHDMNSFLLEEFLFENIEHSTEEEEEEIVNDIDNVDIIIK